MHPVQPQAQFQVMPHVSGGQANSEDRTSRTLAFVERFRWKWEGGRWGSPTEPCCQSLSGAEVDRAVPRR